MNVPHHLASQSRSFGRRPGRRHFPGHCTGSGGNSHAGIAQETAAVGEHADKTAEQSGLRQRFNLSSIPVLWSLNHHPLPNCILPAPNRPGNCRAWWKSPCLPADWRCRARLCQMLFALKPSRCFESAFAMGASPRVETGVRPECAEHARVIVPDRAEWICWVHFSAWLSIPNNASWRNGSAAPRRAQAHGRRAARS